MIGNRVIRDIFAANPNWNSMQQRVVSAALYLLEDRLETNENEVVEQYGTELLTIINRLREKTQNMNITQIILENATDTDVVNLDDFIPDGESNPHHVRPWLLHDHGVIQAIVFAESVQDALDIATDNEKLTAFEVDDETILTDYDEEDSNRLTSIGNDGKLHDIESLEIIQLHNPKMSFIKLMD